MKAEKIDTVAYVIMPNHLHCILHFPKADFNLNTIIGNAKRFMAYEIVKRLKEIKETGLLELLAAGVTEREKRKSQLHKVFKESFDAKPIFSDKFLMQKLDYIHHNPVSGNWLRTLLLMNTALLHFMKKGLQNISYLYISGIYRGVVFRMQEYYSSGFHE